MSKAIYTLATWRVNEGQLDAVLSVLAELAVKSSAEPGNLVYNVHQSTSDANTLVLYEGYQDETALEEHRKSEHYQKLVVAKILPLLRDREIVVTTRL